MADKSKNLIGDVYDLLRGSRDFITPKMFRERHEDMQVDYDNLEIRLNGKYTLRLIRTEAKPRP